MQNTFFHGLRYCRGFCCLGYFDETHRERDTYQAMSIMGWVIFYGSNDARVGGLCSGFVVDILTSYVEYVCIVRMHLKTLISIPRDRHRLP